MGMNTAAISIKLAKKRRILEKIAENRGTPWYSQYGIPLDSRLLFIYKKINAQKKLSLV